MNKEDIKYIILIFIIVCIAIIGGVGTAMVIANKITKTEDTKEYVCASIGVYASGEYKNREFCSNGEDSYYIYTTRDGKKIISEEKID